jgi:light-regulated signal transduction histidine kinase (bacteriophytochrome)
MSDALDSDILEVCAREPIRVPGNIQPHGVLLGLDPADGRVLWASANAGPLLGCPPAQALGHPVADDAPAAAVLRLDIDEAADTSHEIEAAGKSWCVAVRRGEQAVLVEFEEFEPHAHVESIYAQARRLAESLQASATFEEIGEAATRSVRALTGFDRVLLYRFDDQWNGTVLAEDRNDALPSYSGLRFPASDIPAQARDLYRTNRLRQIPSAHYAPVPVLAAPGVDGPLDLSAAALRSVSPVHLQYMRNMGTGASMSISIVLAGQLWGLIACHSREPRLTSPAVRGACDFVGQIVAMRLAGQQLYARAADRVSRQAIHARLLTAMAAATNFLDGLTDVGTDLMALTGAAGAAVITDDRCICVGVTPAEPDIRDLAAWLETRGETEVFATHSLPQDYPESERFRDTASGLLAVGMSQIHASYVLWFRPEVIRTVNWGGDPRKNEPSPETGRINPRVSFETWKETVSLTSEPWSIGEIDAARDLRAALLDIVLLKAEQLAQLTRELERSNKELEAFSYSVSHDLRAPFRHIVGYAELLRERGSDALDEKSRHYLENIIQSAFSAGRLVDDLLHFSQMGRIALRPTPVSLDRLLDEVLRLAAPDLQGRNIEIRRDPLPAVDGDPSLLRQVLQNLIDNALKYTRGRDPAVISITTEKRQGEIVVHVTDNGVGFDMAYVGKLFGVFQRLHRMEEFEGTGIGLANVRRIVERHGGSAWAEGTPGAGARFSFSLPERRPSSQEAS